MATDEAKTNPEIDALFTQLAEPFDPSEIKWRVTHTTQDGSRGAVIAFADPRAYTDRLNQIFTPTGWRRTYDVSTISAVSRMKRDKAIQSGKVLVTCTLTIHGLGCHTGSGEDWADEQNAMTSAEAQAFKRACTCFATSTTSRRCGCRSTNIANRSKSQRSHSGRCQSQARRQERATLLPDRVLRWCNAVPSIRRQRRRSKASGAFSETPSTERSFGA
jgi:hypothetical protein